MQAASATSTRSGALRALPKLVVTDRAEQDLDRLSDPQRDSIEEQILRIGANPTEQGWHLKGSYYCRWSSHGEGNRRILYRIEPGSTERIVIIAIPHRSVAYPRTRR
jgi:mRNA-degrading endonuclease RelE of RelBE toxin-antitoxin system